MTSKTLCFAVRVAVIATIICGGILFGYIIPTWGVDVIARRPEYASFYWPWMIFLWIISLPCLTILVCVWKVSSAIKTEEVFKIQTAKWVKLASLLLFLDAGIFFTGNVVLYALELNHPGILLLSVLINIVVIALAVLAAVLSRYITKAAALQEESEWTV